MKKALLIFIVLVLPFHVFAVENLMLNGQKSYIVTELPDTIIMTCDLAQPGNQVTLEFFFDANGSGEIDNDDIAYHYLVLTDGVGWISATENSQQNIPGDETSEDGKLQTSFPIDGSDKFFQSGQLIIRVTDKDGSTDTAFLLFEVDQENMLLTGKITDAETGAAIPEISIVAEGQLKDGSKKMRFGKSDENGDYSARVFPGNWKVVAVDFKNREYMISDTITVTVVEGENATLDFQLQKFHSFVEGYVKMADGTPVSGIRVMSVVVNTKRFSETKSDETGFYKLGVEAGEIAVSANYIINHFVMDSNWPDDCYIDPGIDTLTINEELSVNLDFVFRPFDCFIEGNCTVDNEALTDVEITAVTWDRKTFTLVKSTAFSDDNGHYRIGVAPGVVNALAGQKEGYQIPPQNVYKNIPINSGQVVNGKNFDFINLAGETILSGQVNYKDGSPVDSAYVVAINDQFNSEEGYRTTRTDQGGNFQFDNLHEGNWQVGVYDKDSESNTTSNYSVQAGTTVADANFVLVSQTTGIESGNPGVSPQEFSLAQNYPNPFKLNSNRQTTQFSILLEKTGKTEVVVYNLFGQVVKKIHAGVLNAGAHSFQWNGKDKTGFLVPSGVYFYRVNAGGKSLIRQMVIVR